MYTEQEEGALAERRRIEEILDLAGVQLTSTLRRVLFDNPMSPGAAAAEILHTQHARTQKEALAHAKAIHAAQLVNRERQQKRL